MDVVPQAHVRFVVPIPVRMQFPWRRFLQNGEVTPPPPPPPLAHPPLTCLPSPYSLQIICVDSESDSCFGI
jgi:hypothetical protein